MCDVVCMGECDVVARGRGECDGVGMSVSVTLYEWVSVTLWVSVTVWVTVWV